MSQRLVTADVNTNIPGAYPSIKVQSNPVGLGAAAGIVVIFGEAEGGASYQNEVLANNFFTPDQLAQVQAKYTSGQIVDAFQALSAPSNDADIVGSANVVYIAKSNSGSKASALVDTDYGTFNALNFGKGGNQTKFQITSTAAEVAPKLSGNTISAFGAALNALTFAIRLNGSTSTTITLSNNSVDHATIAELVVELNAQLPSGIVASVGTAMNNLMLTVAADSAAARKGWGKSFELVDTVSGDLAALGLSAGLTVSSQEPSVEVQLSRSDLGISETLDVASSIGLTIGYAGTTATLTIDTAANMLAISAAGGAGAGLSVDLSQYRTIADLAAYISSQTGYTATASAAAQQLPPSALDDVNAQPMASTSASVQAGRIKLASSVFQKVMATSRTVSFTPNATAGLPAASASPTFLSGGARGATSAADIVAIMNQLAGIQVNLIVPLFSQDATKDTTAGQTDSASTYTIAAINAAVKNHCIQYSTPKLKRNRSAILSMNDVYLTVKAAAQQLANYRCSLAFQQVTQDNSLGVITTFQPWYAAVVAAGMQAGGFYKSITNKLANVISIIDPTGFDSGSPGSVEDALSAGLLFMTNTAAGNSWVSDQTTYGFDTNFVYNSIQAVYTSDILALDLAQSFQAAFVGKSLADVDAGTGYAFLAQKMDGYKKLKLIASSSDAPLGYKNPKISISAPEMDVAVEIKLATAIYFIPITVNISQVQQG